MTRPACALSTDHIAHRLNGDSICYLLQVKRKGTINGMSGKEVREERTDRAHQSAKARYRNGGLSLDPFLAASLGNRRRSGLNYGIEGRCGELSVVRTTVWTRGNGLFVRSCVCACV